jgi:hypothetical protein
MVNTDLSHQEYFLREVIYINYIKLDLFCHSSISDRGEGAPVFV